MKKIFCALFVFMLAQTILAQRPAWKLLWSDEFNKNGLPDSAKWGYETSGNANGWGNNEKQYYTDHSIRNAFVSKGTLKIVARRETIENKRYSSARLSTAGKYNMKYGRIEVRAKLPRGLGTWPAIWMLGSNINSTYWPACGEIDIMEHVGYDKDSIHGTVHTEAYNHIKGTQRGKAVFIRHPYDRFHTYGVNWSPEKIDFLLDGKIYFSFANEHKTAAEWPFDQPFYVILNLAIGGNWGGKKGIDDTIFPAQLEIDYVRIYQSE